MNVVPVALIILPLGVELADQAVGHLAGDVGGHLLHVAVVLQERPGHVQRQVGAIDTALQQQQELGNDLLDVVSHEYLVVVQLDDALAGGELVLDAGEVEYALKVERIFRVQVDPEQRLLEVIEHLAVEFLVLLVGALVGPLHPQWMGVVDLLGLGRLLRLFALLGRFGLDDFADEDGHGHKGAVLLQGAAQCPKVQEVLVLVVDVQRDGRAPLGAVRGLDLVFHAVLARPAHGRSVGIALGVDDHLVRYHEGTVKA